MRKGKSTGVGVQFILVLGCPVFSLRFLLHVISASAVVESRHPGGYRRLSYQTPTMAVHMLLVQHGPRVLQGPLTGEADVEHLRNLAQHPKVALDVEQHNTKREREREELGKEIGIVPLGDNMCMCRK